MIQNNTTTKPLNQNKMEERAKVFSENGQELFFDEQGNLINQNKMKTATLEDLENFKNEIIDSLENLKQTHYKRRRSHKNLSGMY